MKSYIHAKNQKKRMSRFLEKLGTDREISRQAGRQADRQTDRQTDRQRCPIVHMSPIMLSQWSSKKHYNKENCAVWLELLINLVLPSQLKYQLKFKNASIVLRKTLPWTKQTNKYSMKYFKTLCKNKQMLLTHWKYCMILIYV